MKIILIFFLFFLKYKKVTRGLDSEYLPAEFWAPRKRRRCEADMFWAIKGSFPVSFKRVEWWLAEDLLCVDQMGIKVIWLNVSLVTCTEHNFQKLCREKKLYLHLIPKGPFLSSNILVQYLLSKNKCVDLNSKALLAVKLMSHQPISTNLTLENTLAG